MGTQSDRAFSYWGLMQYKSDSDCYSHIALGGGNSYFKKIHNIERILVCTVCMKVCVPSRLGVHMLAHTYASCILLENHFESSVARLMPFKNLLFNVTLILSLG